MPEATIPIPDIPVDQAALDQLDALEQESIVADDPVGDPLEVVDAAPEPEAPPEPKPKKIPGDPQSRINQLTWEREEAKRQAAHLERKFQAAFQSSEILANKLKALNAANHQTTSYAMTIAGEKTKSEIAAAKQALRAAEESGDVNLKIEAQERLNQAQIERNQVEAVQMPEQPVDPVEVQQYLRLRQELAQPVPQQAPPPPPPPDAYVEWRQQNPWYVAPGETPTQPNQRELSLIAEAISGTIAQEGKPVDSAEHFAELQARLQQVAPQFFGAPSQQRPQAQAAHPPARRQSVVAPVGAQRAPQGSRRTTEVTPEQRAMARAFGLDINDYLANANGVKI